MENLYVVEQGCKLKKDGNQFLICKNGIKITTIPAYKIDSILLFGNQQVTTQAMLMAFENGIDILFIKLNGKLKGKLSGVSSKNVFIRFAQYELWRNKNKRIEIAKTFIKGKLENQIRFLKKYNQKEPKLDEFLNKIQYVKDVNKLMGYEGICSRLYFEKFKNIVPKPFEFDGRNRRPPKDEVNALLSLTYTMTANLIISDIEKVGMDSYIGFLHGIKYGRESLGLDLLEEFRQYFCDPFVIKLLNRREIKKEDFHQESEGIYLSQRAFRKYLEKFNSEYTKKRKIFDDQIMNFKDAILNGEGYTPKRLI